MCEHNVSWAVMWWNENFQRNVHERKHWILCARHQNDVLIVVGCYVHSISPHLNTLTRQHMYSKGWKKWWSWNFSVFVYFGFLFENIFTLALCAAVPHIRQMKMTETAKKQQQTFSSNTQRDRVCKVHSNAFNVV